MVKKVIEAYECDICGGEAERYTVSFPDGYLALDRCEKHNKALLKLRDEKGLWNPKLDGVGKVSSFRISSVDEIELQRRQVQDGEKRA